MGRGLPRGAILWPEMVKLAIYALYLSHHVRPPAPRLRRRIEDRLALGIDRTLGALRAIGGEERSQIGESGVAMLGHESGDAVDTPALAAHADECERGGDQVR